MFCQTCGHELAASAAFCSRCGTPAAPAPPTPTGPTDLLAVASVVVSLFAWLAFGLWMSSLGLLMALISLERLRGNPALRGKAIAVTGLLLALAGMGASFFGLWALQSGGVPPAAPQAIEAPSYVPPPPPPPPRYNDDGVLIR